MYSKVTGKTRAPVAKVLHMRGRLYRDPSDDTSTERDPQFTPSSSSQHEQSSSCRSDPGPTRCELVTSNGTRLEPFVIRKSTDWEFKPDSLISASSTMHFGDLAAEGKLTSPDQYNLEHLGRMHPDALPRGDTVWISLEMVDRNTDGSTWDTVKRPLTRAMSSHSQSSFHSSHTQ